MDILGLNGGGSDSLYIKHSSKDKTWQTQDGEINLIHFLVDPTSIQTGWGMYDGMYNFTWDERPGVKGIQPGPDYKRAFSVSLLTSSSNLSIIQSTVFCSESESNINNLLFCWCELIIT